jgi:hypothetical protein
MAPNAPPAISALPRGHEFPPVDFTVPAVRVESYLDAVGDDGAYDGAIPPLAPVALAFAALQQWVSLPDGTLHVGQEVEQLAPVSPDTTLQLMTRIAQRSERQGFVVSVIEMQIVAGDATAIRARATIMAPGAGA